MGRGKSCRTGRVEVREMCDVVLVWRIWGFHKATLRISMAGLIRFMAL